MIGYPNEIPIIIIEKLTGPFFYFRPWNWRWSGVKLRWYNFFLLLYFLLHVKGELSRHPSGNSVIRTDGFIIHFENDGDHDEIVIQS